MIDIHHFKKHKETKLELLDLINKSPKINLKADKTESLKHTDWYLTPESPRPYWSFFNNLLQNWKINMCLKTHSKKCIIHNHWFQQYLKNDHHNWHNHSACQFSSIYYLELPDPSIATEFLDGTKIDIKEGDIITFPSYLYHRSPINKLKKRKSVVVFNSSFEELDIQV
tara:strand:+ start:1859 stop:2365 length:507 start_codon:yes stop_codon:yes gene_type:complete